MNIAMTERGASTAQLLKDKVSLVTGSTSGIGLGIARAFAASGAAVVLNGFGKPEEIKATQAAITSDFGVKVAYSGADMTNPDFIAEMIKMTSRHIRQARRLLMLSSVGPAEHPQPYERYCIDCRANDGFVQH